MRFIVTALLTILCATLLQASAPAGAPEIRFAQQFSMGFLQFDVLRHRDLIKKHAAALGIPDVKVTYVMFNGADVMNDALLSGAIDVASGGMPGLLTIWDKTRGTAMEVRGIAPMSEIPLYLTARDPGIKSIRDFGPSDRIAMPAAKVSMQAVLLEMAAADVWGDADYDRLDALTVTLSPPDATAGLLSGHAGFTAAFTAPPFQEIQLRDPKVHIVLSSEDVIGQSSNLVAWTTKRFHDANPILYRALLDAMQEGAEFIAVHPREAAEYCAADIGGNIDVDLMVELLKDTRFRYVVTPHGTMKWAEFMHRIGRLKTEPRSWKDLFWDELHDRDGS
jgi:NitT/TauT family transport system substrate-binding protein